MLLHLLCSVLMMINAVMCAPGQGRENMMRPARRVKSNNHRYSNHLTLDSIGGGPLLGSIDAYTGEQALRSLDGREERKDMMRLAREDKSNNHTDTSNPNRGTLDPIGGGNILRSLDSYTERQVLRSLDFNHILQSLDGGEGREDMVRLARDDKSNNHTDTSDPNRGTLDPIGGGNLIRSLDSHVGGQVLRSLNRNHVLDPLDSGEGRENIMRMARDDKLNNHNDTSNSMHAIVDPLGGGNLVRSRDSYTNNDESNNHHDTSNSMHAIVDPLGGGNLVRSRDSYTREAKSNNHRNSKRRTLDPIGGGFILRTLDTYTKGQILRSLSDGEGRENIMRLAREDNFNTSNLINGIVDPLGGDNLLSLILLYTYTGGQVYRSLGRNHVLDIMEGGKGRQNMMRLAREDKSNNHHDTSGSVHGVVDSLGGGNMVRSRDSYTGGQILRSLDRNHVLDSLDGGEVVRMLDAITGGDLLSTLESAEGAAVLRALKSSGTNKHPKRMLDSVSGWSFGESKRNFDEIDNVGFTGFAKRLGPYSQYRQLQSALAKKNFDEIDRAGFETYNKRNFDEIDRTGFETFEKREAKE